MSLGGIFFASFVFPSLLFTSISSALQRADKPGYGASIRTRRSLEAKQNTPQKMVILNPPCYKPLMDDFPRDFMSQSDRKHGGAMVHLFLAMYAFIALNILCDDYVVPSVEKIIEKFHIDPEVAGATLLAVSGSASELFTSVIGVFIIKTDIGLGTVVGSAVFNFLFNVAMCALFSGSNLRLSPGPFLRNCLFYSLCIAALTGVTYDKKIYWYEALLLVCMYLIYIIAMYFNDTIQGFFQRLLARRNISADIETKTIGDSEKEKLLPQQSDEGESPLSNNSVEETQVRPQNDDCSVSITQKAISRIKWIILLPIRCMFLVTIPDCRKDRWQKWYLVSFTVSLVWIALLTYFLVWMVSVIGFTLGIPDVIMGLTFLAAGCSVPDGLSSLKVARQGNSDMAVSNAIGSNVFDILICLGLPWLLKTTFVDFGGHVDLLSGSVAYTSIFLFGTVLVALVSLALNKWHLNKRIGITLLILYLVFIAIAIVFQLNL